MKLNIKAFGLTCGLVWGVGLFIVTWWIIALEGLEDTAGYDGMLARVYLGYDISLFGSVIGLAWGFADGLIGGVIFAWLYNLLQSRAKPA